jgi:hypothetical protein
MPKDASCTHSLWSDDGGVVIMHELLMLGNWSENGVNEFV